MHITLTGGAGFRNSGDEALLRMAAIACLRAAPGARVTLLANSAEEAAHTLGGLAVDLAPSPRMAFFGSDAHYTAADTVFAARWQALAGSLVGVAPAAALQALRHDPQLDFIDRNAAAAAYAAIASCDALVVHGGGILTSATRSRLWEIALTVRIAAGLGKRVLLRSQQLGPFDTPADHEMARSILLAACYVSVRDRAMSRVAAHAVAPEALIHERPDDALLLDRDVAAERDMVAAMGLEPGGYLAVGYRHAPAAGMDETAFAPIAAMIRQARAAMGCPAVLVPQGPFDASALERVRSMIGGDARLLEPGDYLRTQMAVLGWARLAIATPHHSLIFALRGGVPVVSPVKGAYYAHKNVGSMRLFGLEDQVIDLAGEAGEIERRFGAALDAALDPAARAAMQTRLAVLHDEAIAHERSFAAALLDPL